jgi:hypothetical protein
MKNNLFYAVMYRKFCSHDKLVSFFLTVMRMFSHVLFLLIRSEMPHRSDNYKEVRRHLKHPYVSEGSEPYFLTQRRGLVLLVPLV